MVVVETDRDILSDRDFNFVDMHHHTNHSDGRRSPAYVAKICRKKRVGVAITDHNKIGGSVYLSKQKDVFSIPGMEVTSSECKDMLTYFRTIHDLRAFYESEVKYKKIKSPISYNRTKNTLIEIAEKVKDYNGIAVLAHPFAPLIKSSYKFLRDKDFVKKMDGIESHNFSVGQYRKTMKFLTDFKKPLTAGSDSHGISAFNTMTVSTKFERDSFIDSILKRNSFIYHNCRNPLSRTYEHATLVMNYVNRFRRVAESDYD